MYTHMADELEIDLNKVDENITNRNKVEERITDLSSKVKTTSQERDAANAKAQEAEAKVAAAEKERDFYASLGDTMAKYPAAGEFKDQIKAKVLAGYSVDDATVSVLAKEGKLTTPPVPRENPAGGSAVVNAPAGGQKSIGEMTNAERRQALVEAEARGDIGLS